MTRKQTAKPVEPAKKQCSLYLPPAVLQQVKIRCAREGIRMNDFFLKAIQEALKGEQN